MNIHFSWTGFRKKLRTSGRLLLRVALARTLLFSNLLVIIGAVWAGYLFWLLVFTEPPVVVPVAPLDSRLQITGLHEVNNLIGARQSELQKPFLVPSKIFSLPPPGVGP